MWHPFKLSPTLILLKTCYLLTKIQYGETGRWQLPPSSMQMTIISSPPPCKNKHWIIPDRNTHLHLEIRIWKGDTCSHLCSRKTQVYLVIPRQILQEINSSVDSDCKCPQWFSQECAHSSPFGYTCTWKWKINFCPRQLTEIIYTKNHPIQPLRYKFLLLIAPWYYY